MVGQAVARAVVEKMGLEIVEHTAGKGEVTCDVTRKGLATEQAREIDVYAFRKGGADSAARSTAAIHTTQQESHHATLWRGFWYNLHLVDAEDWCREGDSNPHTVSSGGF